MKNINLFIEANRRGFVTITYYGEYTAPRTTLSFTRLPETFEQRARIPTILFLTVVKLVY